jgi:hypothetical protein
MSNRLPRPSRENHLAASSASTVRIQQAETLGGPRSRLLAQEAGDVAAASAESKQRAQEQVCAHCFVSGLHPGYARLARTKALRRFTLRQTQMFAPLAQSCS